MDLNLQQKIIRRKERIYDFYYRSIGDKIRKNRLESKLTQEDLAKGICSNTYISKIENNKIAINQEHLNLLMERMNVPIEKIGIPEQMIGYLKKSYQYFFLKDIKSYTELFDSIRNYEFGVLVSIIRLGFFVLTEDYKRAQLIYDDLFRYLNSLEDYGFAVFVIYGCFYNVGINDFRSAKILLKSVSDHLEYSELIFSMYNYLKFIIYGNLYQFNVAREGLDIARLIFVKYLNCKRIIELSMYINIFKIYENSKNCIFISKNYLQDLTPNQKNYYLLLLSELSSESIHYLNGLNKNADYYSLGLFKKAYHLYKNEELEEYNILKQEINVLHYQSESKIDYYNILKLIESKDVMFLKDYLANYILPYFADIQNLYYYHYVVMLISNILRNKNRYKDALTYLLKYFDLKNKFQID